MRQEDTIVEHLPEADTIEVTEDGMTLSLDGLLLVDLERSETEVSDVPSGLVEKLGVHKRPALRIVDVRGAIPFYPPWRTRITNGRY
jgi:hypothetical protein